MEIDKDDVDEASLDININLENNKSVDDFKDQDQKEPTNIELKETQQPNNIQPPVQPKNRLANLLSRKKNFLLVATPLLIVTLAYGGYVVYSEYQYQNDHRYNNPVETIATLDCVDNVYTKACPPPTTPSPTLNNSAEIKYQVVPINGQVKWLTAPEKVANLPIFSNLSTYFSEHELENRQQFTYRVGSLNNGDPVYIVGIDNDPTHPDHKNFYSSMLSQYLLVRKTSTQYVVYTEFNSEFFGRNDDGSLTYWGPNFTSDTVVDAETIPSQYSPPEKLIYNTQKFVLGEINYHNPEFVTATLPTSSAYTSYSKVADLNEGILMEVSYVETAADASIFTSSHMELMTKDHRLYLYYIQNELTDWNNPTTISWNNGATSKSTDFAWVTGCGAGGNNEMATNINISDLEILGNTVSGQNVYTTKATSSPLLVKHYEEFQKWVLEDMIEETYKNLSIDEYKKFPAIFLYQDNLNRWLVFINDKLLRPSGCAKPVVYLYPTVPTFVNVSVDADVTLSDPGYPTLGWRNVLAFPNGKLIYNKQGYESLFWEGYGNGYYPEIITGRFVKKIDAEKQIRADLYSQGLNYKEVKDFMEFWVPKIPKSPYIRLTWLDTRQMQRLAKLNVTPAPQTLIRVFLDMEGVDKPYPLAEQKLTALRRNGFTVIEWGGLARDGSVPKIQ